MIVMYVKDSILNAKQKYIAHGVNCQNKMGSGVAKVIYKEYPIVKSSYHDFAKSAKQPSDLLGVNQRIYLGDEVHESVFNMFTQENYGYDGEKYVSYEAIYNCFRNLTEEMQADSYPDIAIPKIGCGLAGGNWDIVSRIINDATGDDLDVYVYDPNLGEK